MILTKSCHDTDIIRWLVGKPCNRISSFGSLKFFQKENAPEGSTARCTDGCKAEATCNYSAMRIYLEHKAWTTHLAIPDTKNETILNALKTGPYATTMLSTIRS